MADDEEMCPCGKLLHYTDPLIQMQIEVMIEESGTLMMPVHLEGKDFLVNKHYIALHGLKAWELDDLADQGIIERVNGNAESTR